MKKMLSLAIILSMVFSLAAPVFAAVGTWDAEGGDTNINTAANWAGNTNPSFVGTDTVVFGTGGSTATINAAANFLGITFNRDADFEIANGAGSLTIGASGITAAIPGVTSRTYTISESSITAGADQSWNIASDTSLAVSGAIAGAGRTITKQGLGTLTLSGTNTLTGLIISAGTVVATGSNSALPIAVNLQNTGTLSILDNTARTFSSGIYFSGTSYLNSDTATAAAGVTHSLTSTLTPSSGTLNVGLGGNATSAQNLSFIGAFPMTLAAGGTAAINVTAAAPGGTLSINSVQGQGANFTVTGVAGGGTENITTGSINLTGGANSTGGTLNITTSGNISITGAVTTTGGGSGFPATYNAGNITLNSTGGSISSTTLTANGAGSVVASGAAGGNVSINCGTTAAITSITAKGGDGAAPGVGGSGGSVTVNGGTVTVSGGINTSKGAGPGAPVAGALNLNGGTLSFASLTGGGNVVFGGGTLKYTATMGDYSAQIKNSSAAINIDTNGNNITFASAINSSNTAGLTKSGAGTLTLTAANTYTGSTTISAGTLKVGINDAITTATALSLDNSATAILDLNDFNQTIGSLSGGGTNGGNVTLGSGVLTVGNSTDTTYSGVISETGGLTKVGGSVLTLSGANTYTGATTVTAGTLRLGVADVISDLSDVTVASTLDSNGFNETVDALTVQNGGTLEVGSATLTAGDTYDQDSGSTVNITVSSVSASGKIVYTTAAGTSINSGSTINITVPGTLYVPTGTVYTAIDGSGGTVGLPTINVLGTSRLSLTPSASSGKLLLTANRSEDGFASVAANGNEANVGNVLDNVTNPTSDMTTILNTMEGLNNSQTDSALNSMEPDTDGATLQVTQATLDQLTDAVLGHQESLRNGNTGVSSGTEMLKGVDVWAQAFGSYLHQAPRQSSQGYNANIWGTALGFDLPIITNVRVGTCFGFAQDYVRGKDNSNRSDINSYQWTIYGEYAKDAYYIDLSGSFAFNTYDASRNVAVGAINRTASADYNGQQYAAYIEGGYTFNFKDFGFEKVTVSKLNTKKPCFSLTELNLTPLVSFQYQHLYLDKYTETGANAMNLTVKSQNYDIAQSGFGIKLDYPLDTKYGKLVPELRFKWLYDWIGDSQANTSNFNGGGGSFATNGFTPAQSSWDFGTKLTMFTKNNWTLAANYDFELKEDFYGHYGYVNAKYSF